MLGYVGILYAYCLRCLCSSANKTEKDRVVLWLDPRLHCKILIVAFKYPHCLEHRLSAEALGCSCIETWEMGTRQEEFYMQRRGSVWSLSARQCCRQDEALLASLVNAEENKK